MVLTDVYKYFRTAVLSTLRLTFMVVVRQTLANTVLATFGEMINRRVRNGISIVRGQTERLIRASATFFCTSLADIALRVDNRVGGIDDRAGFTR